MAKHHYREVLAGPLAKKFGFKPKVEAPGEQQSLLLFIEDLLPVIENKPIYRRDNVPMFPNEEKGRLDQVRPSAFRSWVDRYAVCTREKPDKKTGESEEVIKSIPKDVAEAVLTSEDFWPRLREVMAVNPVPRPSIAKPGAPMKLLMPGYDDATETLTFNTLTSGYNEQQTLGEAIGYFRHLFMDFPFSDWVPASEEEQTRAHAPVRARFRQSRSQAAQLAGMLSQFAIGCVPANALRMGFAVTANAQRSGKSLLTKLMIVPVNGKMALQSWTKNDEELKKVIDSELLRASNYVVFDNVKGMVQSQVVESAMTTPTWTGRVLGKSEMFEAAVTASFYFTGNQIKMSSDMANRCLFVDLYVEEADVQERTIDTPIDDSWLMEESNRHDILTALWTLVREWDKAGRPKPTGKSRMGFEKWCDVIAGIVEFAGFGDCLAPRSDLEEGGDNESKDSAKLIAALSDAEVWVTTQQAQKLGLSDMMDISEFPSRLEYTFAELTNIAASEGLFDWALHGKVTTDIDDNFLSIELDDKSNSTFGKLVAKYFPQPPQDTRVPCHEEHINSCEPHWQ